MALKVTTAPTYTGKLKVVTNYQPKVNLKVTTKPVNYVTPKTVNPQKTAPASTFQGSNYNPQKTATPAQLNNAQVGADWASEQAKLLRAETDARIARENVERKRLADAKNVEISGYKGDFLGTLKDKVTFGSDTRARNARELAYQYYVSNEKNWATSIMARQRNYENRAGELKNWVLQADTEEEWNKRVTEATTWLDSEYKSINNDVTDYTTEQEQLAFYSQTPLTSKFANVAQATKKTASDIGGFGWNVLSTVAEQPERVVNTVKNFVNPNNLRMYYGGEEKKGGITGQGSNPFNTAIDQLKKSYNASDEQRTLGFSKEDEAERLRKLQQGLDNRPDGKNIFGTSSKSGFLRGGGLDKARIKYGDDLVNLMADPLNFLANGWAKKGVSKISNSVAGNQVKKFATTKSDDFYKWAGKNKTVSNLLISREARKANPNTFNKWLGKRVGTTADDFYADNKELIEFRNKASDTFSTKADDFKRLKKGISGKTQAGLSKLTDDEARILQEFMLPQTFDNSARGKVAKNVFDWTDIDLPRGFDKSSKNKIEDLARALKNESDTLTKMGIDYDEFYNAGRNKSRFLKKAHTYKKGEGLQYSYVPFYNPKQVAGQPEKSRNASRWYLKQKTGNGAIKQGSESLKASFAKRANAQLWNDTPEGRWLANNADDYKEAIGEANKALDWRKQGYKGKWFNKLNEASFKNPVAPSKLWKKSVLALNPAWYVNNIGTNIPFSISAGGAGVIPEYLKMLKKAGRNFDDIPEGVRGNIDEFVGGGRLGKLGSKVEDTSRIATFRALKKRGFSDEDALKEVNRWLFDYSVKNYERPFRAVAPFYKWQANLMRLSAQMPFTNPRSANAYSEFHKQFFERPINQLPNETQTYVDPDSGETKTYNPREAYKGKMWVGNDKDGNPKFANTPMFALNPESLTDFGLNPALSYAQDFASSTDRFGNRNTNKSKFRLGLDKFPQARLTADYLDRNNDEIRRWFSDSGNSKWKQGFDKTKPNYDKYLDKGETFKRTAKSFFGVPNVVKFDKKEYDVKFRLSKFNEEFFSIDWDKKREEDYNKAQAEMQELAKKYDFDLQEDIFDNYWSKYDTATTTETKRKKQDAFKFNSDFWEDYYKIPAGSKTRASERRPFLINKIKEWRDNNTFLENGYYNIPKFTKYDEQGNSTNEKAERNPFVLEREESESRARRVVGQAKYQRYLEYQKAKKTGDWSWFGNNGGTSEKAKAYRDAKASGDFTAYRAKYGDSGKETPYQYDGKFFKSQETMDKYVEGKFWRDYYALDNVKDRQALLDEFPQFRTFKQPQTQEEWDSVKAILKEQRNKKLAGLTGFTDSRESIKRQIERTLPSSFGGMKRLRYKA